MNQLLSPKEKLILSHLWSNPSLTVSELSKEVLINRTSLYPLLEKLVQKSLVSVHEQEGKLTYSALSAEEVTEWIQQQKTAYEREMNQISEWVATESSAAKKPLRAKVTYFEGMQGMKLQYADSWRNNYEKKICAITDVKAAVETAEAFFHTEYMPQRVAHDISIRDIMTESQESNQEIASNNQLRDIRIASGLFTNLGIEINLYDNKTSIIAYDRVKPSGVIIENQTITNALKNIFEYIWKDL